jgi:hypothetical protein
VQISVIRGYQEEDMVGKIKSGLGTLIGNAGEYYVMAELLKRDWIAALAPRNAPDFDILVTNGEKTVKVRVKTKSEKYDVWQWQIKKDGTIFRNITDLEDFTILVNLTANHKDMDYFIMPTHTLNRMLEYDFNDWVSTPGKGGHQRSSNNPKRHLPYLRYQQQLTLYKNNWDILWE